MANEHIEEVGLKFKADGSADYLSTLKEIGNEQATLYAEYVRDVAMMDKDATATEKLTAKKQMLELQIDSQSKKVSVLRAQVEAMTGAEERDEAAISKKKKELAYAEAQLGKYNKQLDSTVDSLKAHSEWTDKASGKLNEMGEKLDGAGKKMSIVSGAAAAIGAASIAAFNEVDEGLDTIITKTGASGEALDALEGSFRNVYGSMPATAAEAGVAIGEVNTRFGATGKTLEDLSATFIQFSKINETDLNGSIGSTARTMQQWKLEVSEAPNLLGLITSEAQRTGISVDKLMGLVEQNGATFKEMDLSVSESIALLANFEASGVNTETALGALRKSAAAYTADGKSLSVGLAETVTAIQNAKTETEALAIAQEVFGAKGALEMATAIREGRLSVDDLSAGMQNMGTVVSDTFNATLDAPDKLTVAMNNVKLAGADLGGTILEMVTPMLEQLATSAQNLATWFNGLDDGTKRLIVTVGAIVAALGPALIISGKVFTSIGSIIGALPKIATGIKTVQTAMTAMNFNPVTIGIMAIIAIILLLWTKCEWFRDLVSGLWSWIRDSFGSLTEWFLSSVKSIGTNIMGIFSGIIDFIKNVFSGNWKGAWESVVSIFGNVFGLLGNLVKAPINAVISVINAAISGINKIAIDVPDWVPGVGGRHWGFSLPLIPMLANGGNLLSGMAIVAEAGPELIHQRGGRTTVTPLSSGARNSGLDNVGLSDETLGRLASTFVQALIDAGFDKTAIYYNERELGRALRGVLQT